MNDRERFIYYAKSNGIDPAVLGKKIKMPRGSMVIIGQRVHGDRPIIVKAHMRKLAMPIHTLRKYMMQDKSTRKFLNMESEQVNVDLWFKS